MTFFCIPFIVLYLLSHVKIVVCICMYSILNKILFTLRSLINQCQIITVLILKSDIIEDSRIELRGVVLTVPSNQIKVTLIIILPFNLVPL